MMRFVFSLLSYLIFTAIAPSATADEALVEAAQDRLKVFVRYDGAYVSLDYPNGDVPRNTGVCTDVIIRSYRAAFGFDFQKAVHEDMRANFDAYPKIWGLKRADKNIDHRRVPNLETFLTRQGKELPISKKAGDYKAGDIVTWRLGGRLGGSLPHIGIVSDNQAKDGTPLIIHNIGAGPKEDNILFDFQINGHYRFIPSKKVAVEG